MQQALERLLNRLPHYLAHMGANLLLLDLNHAPRSSRRLPILVHYPSGSPFVLEKLV